jgi:hypothetical protein
MQKGMKHLRMKNSDHLLIKSGKCKFSDLMDGHLSHKRSDHKIKRPKGLAGILGRPLGLCQSLFRTG